MITRRERLANSRRQVMKVTKAAASISAHGPASQVSAPMA